MEPEKKLTPLEEKWKAEAKEEGPKKTTLNDAYTEEEKSLNMAFPNLY
jgi:hypothetical protein